jgi:hypothetical protein
MPTCNEPPDTCHRIVRRAGIERKAMRQKYLIKKDNIEDALNIKEYANLDREYKYDQAESKQEFFTLIGEETYQKEQILSAIGKGRKNLIAALRTQNLYPVSTLVEKIADSVMDLYRAEDQLSVELLFDDKESVDGEISSDR